MMAWRLGPHWLRGRAWQTNAALCLIGFALICFTRQLIREFHHYAIGFSSVAGWSVLLYAAAVLLILTQPVDRYTFPIILAVGVACRLITLMPEPFLSSDIYRYVWDGVVQHAHISPYRYVPGDPALAFLRGPHRDIFDHINRRDYAHTIYPPAAQVLFYLVTFFNSTVPCMKLAMVFFEGITVYGLIQLLRKMGIRKERTLLYIWCPLIIWEIGSSGHIDSAVMAFMVLALVARYRSKPIATGLFLGTAILIKLYPIALLPALFRRGKYKMPATVAALAAFLYACYSSVGLRVFGFLGGYVKEEGMESGTRYFILELFRKISGLHALPVIVYLLFVGAVFASIVFWCWKTSSAHDVLEAPASIWTNAFRLPAAATYLPPAMVLALALMLLFSPHYPWYVAWLIPFLVILPSFTLFTYTSGLFYLCTTPLGAGTVAAQFQLNEVLYTAVLLAALIDIGFHLWRLRHRPNAGGPAA